jgi:surfeit locus 1 family protein
MALPMLAVLIALGSWQLERRAWKLALIAEMQARLTAPEIALDALPDGPARDYRRVVVSGRFDHAKEVYWLTTGPEPEGEPGYHVITPLLREDGPAILIDRGFVPVALRDALNRPQGQAEGPVTIKGILRESQPAGLFTPPDDPGRRLIYARNIPRIAAEIGLAPVMPVFIEADAAANPGGYPLGGQTVLALRNEHLQYALTWFGLAAALVIVYLLYHRSRGRLG